MRSKKLFKLVSCLIVFIFIVNYLAGEFYWYSAIWYFDIIMHFLGGFWLGIALIWFFNFQDLHFKSIFKIILGVLLIGIVWELYEVLVNNLIAQYPFNTLDTISDVCFDLAGGFFSVFSFLKILNYET